MCDSLQRHLPEARRRVRTGRGGRAGRRRRDGVGGGDVKVCKGGRAGDTPRFRSPMPTHQEPLATPIMAVGHAPPASPNPRAPWSPRRARSGALGWGAGRERARGPGAGGARREAGSRGGPGPPLPPRPPTGSSRLGGKSPPRSPRALPAPHAGPTCGSQRCGGRAPLRGHRSFLLLGKPPVQLPASRTGGAGTPGQGAGLAAGDM